MTTDRGMHCLQEHYRVAVIGAGPAGTGAVLKLADKGIRPLLLIERSHRAGGIPALYKRRNAGIPTFVRFTRGRVLFGETFADWFESKLSARDVDIALEAQVIDIHPMEKALQILSPRFGAARVTADAVIMACGAREKNPVEKGWIGGARPARVFFTRHIIEMEDVCGGLPLRNPVILGSDILAYAAAAKLQAQGIDRPRMLDSTGRPRCPFHKRLFFLRWGRPRFSGGHSAGVRIVGRDVPAGVQPAAGETIPCDSVLLCGELTPNSELALSTALEVDPATRMPRVDKDFQMSEPGWFCAGNMLGGEHGAEWCYFHGRRVARSVIRYLHRCDKVA